MGGVGSRGNGGGRDPAGQFLIGTIALDGRRHEDALYRREHDGSITVVDDTPGANLPGVP